MNGRTHRSSRPLEYDVSSVPEDLAPCPRARHRKRSFGKRGEARVGPRRTPMPDHLLTDRFSGNRARFWQFPIDILSNDDMNCFQSDDHLVDDQE